MEVMDILKLILAIVSGVATCIPLVIQLIKLIKESAKSKNWTGLMQLVLRLMTEAENNFATGVEREEYVVSTIKAMESTLNYDVDEQVVREMIAAIITASKTINTKK